MASRTSKGGRPGSPVKKSSTAVNNNRNIDASVSGMYQNEDFSQADVVRGLTEREVEIDHLKTTVFALNEQVQVLFCGFISFYRLSMISRRMYLSTRSSSVTPRSSAATCRFISLTLLSRLERILMSTAAIRSS